MFQLAVAFLLFAGSGIKNEIILIQDLINSRIGTDLAAIAMHDGNL